MVNSISLMSFVVNAKSPSLICNPVPNVIYSIVFTLSYCHYRVDWFHSAVLLLFKSIISCRLCGIQLGRFDSCFLVALSLFMSHKNGKRRSCQTSPTWNTRPRIACFKLSKNVLRHWIKNHILTQKNRSSVFKN